jgi:hypothetical protein
VGDIRPGSKIAGTLETPFVIGIALNCGMKPFLGGEEVQSTVAAKAGVGYE